MSLALLAAFVARAEAVVKTNTATVSWTNAVNLYPATAASTTTITVGDEPNPPGGLAADRAGALLLLSWTPAVPGSAALSGYRVYRSTSAGFTPAPGNLLAPVAGAAAASYPDAQVAAGVTYCYIVRAVDVNDLESADSNTACAGLPAPVAPPAAPPGLSALATGGAMVITWSPAAAGSRPVSGYQVYRATFPGLAAGGGTLLAAVTGAGASRYADASAAEGVTYYYVVRAVDTAGLGGAVSNEASARLAPAVARTIRVVVQVFDASGRLVRTLLDAMAATEVTLARVGTGGLHAAISGPEGIPVLLSDGVQVPWDGKGSAGAFAPNGLYTVRVTSTGPDGRTRVTSATVAVTRAYGDLIVDAILAPNPARETAWIGYGLASSAAEVDVRVYNVAGELLHRGRAAAGALSYQWNLRNADGVRVSAGLYLVVLDALDPMTQRRDREILKLAVEDAP